MFLLFFLLFLANIFVFSEKKHFDLSAYFILLKDIVKTEIQGLSIIRTRLSQKIWQMHFNGFKRIHG